MKNFLLLSLILFSLNACTIAGEANSSDENKPVRNSTDKEKTAPDAGGENVSINSDIRKIDFKNFTYEPSCAGEETRKVTVKDGEFSEVKQEDGYVDRFYFTVMSVVYGDVTADGNEDAVILTNCNMGGTGQFTEGFIYELKNEKPSLAARIPGGDRAYGGLKAARVESGLLVVESYDPGEESASCCPEFFLISRYKVSGGKLVESGKAERRELFPAQKVSFPKGATQTTLKLKFDTESDRKRFSLGARKGQILRVFSQKKGVFISLQKGEAETISDEEGTFVGKLSETGEFVIEIQHYTETPDEISVTFEIK